MLNANDSQIKLEKYHADCVKFWTRQNGIDEREAYKRALEYDLIEIFKVNNGCLHDPYSPKGDELDKQTTLDFLKYRCQDLYGKEWEEHWKEYNLLKKFNIFGAQHKGWLPPSYGKKKYSDMTSEEKAVVNDFEGETEYNKVMCNTSYYLADTNSMLMLDMAE